MQTVLLTSKDQNKAKEEALRLCKTESIDPLDITYMEFESSLGIEEIRTMQKSIFLKPIKSEQKAVIIANMQTATVQAQNALLKVLEEPPKNTLLMLLTTSENVLLPTVLSRCTIVHLDQVTTEAISKDSLEKYKDELQQLLSASTTFRLKTAQDIAANKESAYLWLTNMLHAARELMLANSSMSYAQLGQSLQETYIKATTTNISLRFLLENCLLNI